MLSRFRGIMGYSKGGVVGNLQTVARSNGDDTFTINTLKKGEGIIPLPMMPEWKTLISTLPTLNNMIKSIGTSPIINIQGMELILPNVTDYESLRAALLDDPTFNRAVLTTASSAMIGSNSLKSKRFR